MAVPICIHIILDSNSNDKLAWIAIIEISKAVPAKCDGVDSPDVPEIDFDPAIRAVADPACPRAIESIVDVGSIVNPAVSRERIFGNGGPR